LDIKKLIFSLLLFGLVFAQEAPNIFWNSLSTELVIKVPIIEDESLENGQVQISATFDKGKSFKKLGDPIKIIDNDIDDIKDIIINADVFESLDGFKEGADVQFKTQIWDRVGNSTSGEVGDSILTIDQTSPELLSLSVSSSNQLGNKVANPMDSIDFVFEFNEPVKNPYFLINNDKYVANSVSSKSWKLNYKTEDSNDGVITFELFYEDLAGNPGQIIEQPSDGESVLYDGTIPNLESVNIYTSNNFDNVMAKEADTLFLEFISSESIQNVIVKVGQKEASKKIEDGMKFKYSYIFSKTDSNGVVPFSISFEDLAGNKGDVVKETSDESFVTLDTNPPLGSKIQTVGSNFDGAKKKKPKPSKVKSEDNSTSKEEIFGIPLLYIIIGASAYLFLFLLTWASFFKIFRKAGESGWKALVPLFNIFVYVKILKKPTWWIVIYLLFPISYFILALDTSKLFNKKILFALGLMFLPFIFYPMLAFGKSQFGKSLSAKKVVKKKVKKK